MVNDENDLLDRRHYRNVSTRANDRVAGLDTPPGGNPLPDLPGPPMKAAERRIAGQTAPKTANGSRI